MLSFRPKGEIFPAGRHIYSLAKDFSVANAPSKWQTLGAITEIKHTHFFYQNPIPERSAAQSKDGLGQNSQQFQIKNELSPRLGKCFYFSDLELLAKTVRQLTTKKPFDSGLATLRSASAQGLFLDFSTGQNDRTVIFRFCLSFRAAKRGEIWRTRGKISRCRSKWQTITKFVR